MFLFLTMKRPGVNPRRTRLLLLYDINCVTTFKLYNALIQQNQHTWTYLSKPRRVPQYIPLLYPILIPVFHHLYEIEIQQVDFTLMGHAWRILPMNTDIHWYYSQMDSRRIVRDRLHLYCQPSTILMRFKFVWESSHYTLVGLARVHKYEKMVRFYSLIGDLGESYCFWKPEPSIAIQFNNAFTIYKTTIIQHGLPWKPAKTL